MSEDSEQLGPWSVAVGDQLAAAIKDENWEACGELGVEGFMLAVAADYPDGEVPPFEYFIACLTGLHYNHITLVGAQALKLAYQQRISRREQ